MRIVSFIYSPILFFGIVNSLYAHASTELSTNEFQSNPVLKSQYYVDSDIHSNSVKQLPEATYQYLENAFSTFYKKITFNTSIINDTFNDNLNAELISIPLIAQNSNGVQFEVFGNFSDLSKQYLDNLPLDHALHDYLVNSKQSNVFLDGDLSLGAGFSVRTSESSKLKLIYSNSDIPGYGNSSTLLGFESEF